MNEDVKKLAALKEDICNIVKSMDDIESVVYIYLFSGIMKDSGIMAEEVKKNWNRIIQG